MSARLQPAVLFAIVIALFLAEGTLQNTFFSGSWNVALGLLNMALISAVMVIGVNLQWGVAGLFYFGVMGFVALGGLAAVLISEPPTTGAWGAGGYQVVLAL